jgi:hypothetical protein
MASTPFDKLRMTPAPAEIYDLSSLIPEDLGVAPLSLPEGRNWEVFYYNDSFKNWL